MEQITNDVDGKLDRMELQSVKDFLGRSHSPSYPISIRPFSSACRTTENTIFTFFFAENRLSKLKGSAVPPPPPREEDADPAGMRRFVSSFFSSNSLVE